MELSDEKQRLMDQTCDGFTIKQKRMVENLLWKNNQDNNNFHIAGKQFWDKPNLHELMFTRFKVYDKHDIPAYNYIL